MPVVVAAFEFSFMGGSMGSVVGERFLMGVKKALQKVSPLFVFPPVVAHVCKKH